MRLGASRGWPRPGPGAESFCQPGTESYSTQRLAAPSSASFSPVPAGGALRRRWSRYEGIFTDEFCPDSGWIRERASLHLPPLVGTPALVIEGEWRPHPDVRGVDAGLPALTCAIDGAPPVTVTPKGSSAQPWRVELPLPLRVATGSVTVTLTLQNVGWTNLLAWAGRVTGFGPWQRFRAQNRNRQLRVRRVLTAGGDVIYDFGNRHSPYVAAFARKHAKIGLNVVGFLTADLGIAESARCMVRAADAAGIPTALLDLKLNVKNRRGDLTYAARLQSEPTHDVSVFHLDPPAARDLDHHHGRSLRAGRYNIAYWAWELPEFPDAWTPYCEYFDEIWCPSDFVREAIAMRSPVPVLTMPHAIAFERPTESAAELRARFGLPPDRLLFLFVYDLNSYSPRKNAAAVVEAFRASGLSTQGAALVLKTHSTAGNEAELAALRASVADLPGTVIIDTTLSRADVYRLEAACDVFVSLHRSEGFGLAVAECMFLGKPVISTDWSATAEFVNPSNGCPVRARLVTLDRNIGPYSQGQTWADPDLHQAADWMVRLARDPELRQQLGAAARATIEARFAPAQIGARYRRRLEAIATR